MDTKKYRFAALLMVLAIATMGMAGATTCKQKITTVVGHAGDSGSWTLQQTIRWCYSNSKITSYSTSTYGETRNSGGLAYKGIVSQSVSGGVGSSYVDVKKTGWFYGYSWGVSIKPYIRQYATATGGLSVSTGGCGGSCTVTTI